MYLTMRRYEGIDKLRSDEVTSKIGESLMPSLTRLPGFGAHYLVDTGEGILTSVGIFENEKEAHESTRIAATWVREQKLESALPNAPRITTGPVIAHESHAATATNGAPVRV